MNNKILYTKNKSCAMIGVFGFKFQKDDLRMCLERFGEDHRHIHAFYSLKADSNHEITEESCWDSDCCSAECLTTTTTSCRSQKSDVLSNINNLNYYRDYINYPATTTSVLYSEKKSTSSSDHYSKSSRIHSHNDGNLCSKRLTLIGFLKLVEERQKLFRNVTDQLYKWLFYIFIIIIYIYIYNYNYIIINIYIYIYIIPYGTKSQFNWLRINRTIH